MKLSALYDDADLRAALELAEANDRERLSRLTRTHRELLPLLCDGRPNKVAAYTAGISVRTVENHRAEIMRRTECKSFPELIRLYLRTESFIGTIYEPPFVEG